jgi:hypothetical protein
MSNLYRADKSRNRPSRQDTGKVLFLHRPPTIDPVQALQSLTYRLVMEKARRGTLEPALVEYLLLGVGMHP